MGAYEQGGYRPSPTVCCLPSNSRLAAGEHPPPSGPTRHQTMADVVRNWTEWYTKIKAAHKEHTDIGRQCVTLAVKLKPATTAKATGDWHGSPSAQSTAYNSAFKKGMGGASAADPIFIESCKLDVSGIPGASDKRSGPCFATILVGIVLV